MKNLKYRPTLWIVVIVLVMAFLIYSVVTATGYPEITIIGDNPISIDLHELYNDPGATAFDSVDGDLTGYVIATTNINIHADGQYFVQYKVTNSNGETSTEQRSVIVGVIPDPYPSLDTIENATVAVCHCEPQKGCITIMVSAEGAENHIENHEDDYLGVCRVPVFEPTPTLAPEITPTLPPEPTPEPEQLLVSYLPIVSNNVRPFWCEVWSWLPECAAITKGVE